MMAARFSAAATTYDRHAQPQARLAQAVCAQIPDIAPARILEFGCGTGQLTGLLAARFPAARIEAVDVADAMLEQGRQRWARFPQIVWRRGDAQTYRATSPFPVVASSAALHWVPDLPAAFRNVFSHLQPGGLFALGMMLAGTLRELREAVRAVAPAKASPDLLPETGDVIGQLRAAGFIVRYAQPGRDVATYPDAVCFLKALHEQGVTGAPSPARPRTALTRGELDRLIAHYQQSFGQASGVVATYETAVILAEKRQ